MTLKQRAVLCALGALAYMFFLFAMLDRAERREALQRPACEAPFAYCAYWPPFQKWALSSYVY